MASQLLFNETQSIKRAASLISGLDDSKFSLLVTRIVQKLHLRDERNFTEEEEAKLRAVFGLEAKDLELVLETVSFFLEQAAYHNAKASVLMQQLQNVHLSEAKAGVIVKIWTANMKDVVEKLKQRSFYPKQLEEVNWRLNLEMAQASKSKMKVPNAMFEFVISGSQQDMKSERVRMEFTHDELFEFYQQLETVQQQLDSLS
ncbi:COMM domain-containing protein 10-like [Corticium candelabrum]|uniref:COMM domain-containing protein 10-like n=1 Tax=Corticium candelabrum TaxID=121492 RepID=UPI002E26E463|nr:COMM domain-containing protein 10-like [Corticium candelabrum]